jgi:hypothetical protein
MELRTRLLEWMRGGDGDFAAMALEVFAYQFERNIPYRRYCEALGVTPENIGSWHDIPAVPTDVFKLPGIALRCFPESEITGHFLTSGTTREVKGKHELRSLELYEASVFGAVGAIFGRPPLFKNHQPYFFSQRAAHAPHSSLVRMFEILSGRAVLPGGFWLIDAEGHFQLESFQPQTPAALLGTSLALLKACDEIPALTLPEGSWIFETGGSKGLKKSFTPAEVRARLSAHFGVPESCILNEYGMTELFSQFYKWGDEETHVGPPWVAIRVIDVHTGQPAPSGQPGYLEIIDLANLDTVSAVRTQDLAIAVGEREFILLGRDPEAVARGCSRGVEDVLSI